MSTDYRDENVLQHAREAFQETIALKIQHLRRYITKGTNPALTGDYIEEIVRSFVRKWIGSLQLRHGTFYSHEFEKSGKIPLQIDGIVWNPKAGPAILEEGDFIVVHPVYCTSVIEIKTSIGPIADFQKRLQQIYHTYMHWGTTTHVIYVELHINDPTGRLDHSSGVGFKQSAAGQSRFRQPCRQYNRSRVASCGCGIERSGLQSPKKDK